MNKEVKDIASELISQQYKLVLSDRDDESMEDDGTETHPMSEFHSWELDGMIRMARKLGILTDEEITNIKTQNTSVE